jgi:hypothetical protein
MPWFFRKPSENFQHYISSSGDLPMVLVTGRLPDFVEDGGEAGPDSRILCIKIKSFYF